MIEVLKQALEAFAFMPNEIIKQKGVQEVIASLRQAISELESQEPVAWMDGNGNLFSFVWNVGIQQGSKYLDETLTPLYTHPLQRTWVGLTDEEIDGITCVKWEERGQIRAIEAKLKELNG
jgi:hypothetical protein